MFFLSNKIWVRIFLGHPVLRKSVDLCHTFVGATAIDRHPVFLFNFFCLATGKAQDFFSIRNWTGTSSQWQGQGADL